MLKRLIILSLAALLALPTMAAAEFRAGDMEFTLGGSGGSDNDLDNNNFSVAGSLGYFWTDVIEGIIRQELGFIDTEDGSSWTGATSVGADFHLVFGQAVPFLGASLGYIYGDDVDETWFAGPEGGIKMFVNDTTFVNAMVQYQWLFDDESDADNNFDDGRFFYTVGLGVRF